MPIARNRSGQRQRIRHSAYKVDDDDRIMLAKKAKNYVIKNLPEDGDEEVASANDSNLVKAIMRKAKIDDIIIVKVERHPP